MKQIAKKNVFLKFRIDINYKKYMQKTKILTKLIIAVLILTAGNVLNAQQVINFYALEEPYHILTKADVDAILGAEWDGSDFVAEISPEIMVIAGESFCGLDDDVYGNPINKYLVKVNGPNVTEIEPMAFAFCEILDSIYFPKVEIISRNAFIHCYALTKIYLPEVRIIYPNAFLYCYNLDSIILLKVTEIQHNVFRLSNIRFASFGLGLNEPTNIKFGQAVFYYEYTPNADLVLSNYVIPAPNLENNTWQSTTDPYHVGIILYEWKSITLEKGIKEEIKNYSIDVYPIPAKDFVTVRLELENSCNVRITICDISGKEISEIGNEFADEGLFIKTINIEHLNKGVYFLKFFIDGNYIAKKVIRY